MLLVQIVGQGTQKALFLLDMCVHAVLTWHSGSASLRSSSPSWAVAHFALK
jgi:hypothetical protein